MELKKYAVSLYLSPTLLLMAYMWFIIITPLCMISDDWKLICVISSLFYADSWTVISFFFYHVQQ
jgi:hypothetical protein